ncbi:LSU ribosomal protein L21P [Desulfacinum hydrothermale DSM 13146]|uniref:Large ribosomal subunit protein bL21 n=1 Tax=Desulfacinum hydrothermale DSM 13146 TaxID=1121390 RepID=A0A1W1XB43_9BACT|nr:50S ribosomal protein L21 [Desulfacinum hydrothermale]SMC21063.1 LSU ribosomal protein L21P [Desulfacinum hydrothermale DSM 13146]
MYAIVESGGKQYKAEPGAVLKLEKLAGEPGDEILLDQVLLVADGEQVQVGRPVLEDKVVRGRIVEQARHKKVVIFKYKRRKDYHKKQGHRQYYTAVRIEGIEDRAAQS